MFSVGDRIVHPLHGAGIIRALAEKEIDGFGACARQCEDIFARENV